MKMVLMSILCGCVLLMDAPADAEEPKVNCEKADTQMEMNYCAEQDFNAADADLNAQWKVTRKALADWDKKLDVDQRGAENALLKSQRAWIDYRDGECEAEGYSAHGGTMEPMLVMSCKAELSKVRTEELKQLADTIGQQ
ncbi:lysozyme inhibitor LprI family protein [Rhizobium oryzicola]|uniref:Lysozyme inhibitor LprI family protein n=1 Tax=Rhizobium oryzicola TaxID=1232668 RepID=A0ABT8SUP5_9HYPH|nr:lysozyme inhibitor LprI family protein [Rhizobium oryzicola]MDO1582167.1 lysozyme inhibitor LprI family protein [Rhizobium oryzicola]